MKKSLKICLITGARADYDRLPCLIDEIKKRRGVQLEIVAMNMHLSPEHGMTVQEIENDGHKVSGKVEMLLSTATDSGVAKSIGIGILGVTDVLERLSPDIVLVLGDRFELISVASACICLRIPIAHIAGGEITEGAIDDQVRHIMTKASHLHLVSNRTFEKRVRQMGEESWRICVSGAPGLDVFKKIKYKSREKLSREMNIDLSLPTAMLAFHPETLAIKKPRQQVRCVIDAIKKAGIQCVASYPNADMGGMDITEELKRFADENKSSVRLFKSLGWLNFYSLMRCASFIIGNSSSGVIEASSFNLPAINVGKRQAGRIHGNNVIQADYSVESVRRAINKALVYKGRKFMNPYGDMQASRRIVDFIENAFAKYGKDRILQKRFVIT